MNHTPIDDPVPVDVLIVGGGVQGLTCLRELRNRGFAAALISDSPIGSGQTLHSHGFLNSGYQMPDPELRRSVEQDWLPFVRKQGVVAYGHNRFFGVIPDHLYNQLAEAWETCDYPYESVTAEALPSGFHADVHTDGPVHIVRVKEYCVPKRGLVRALTDHVADRIVIGDVTEVMFEPGECTDDITISTVEIEPRSTGESVTLRPGAVIIATGTGTKPFVRSITTSRSFATAAGETSDQLRTAIDHQLGRITHERAHMICLRGPKKVLPGINVLLAEPGVAVISADVNPTHDRVSGDQRTWYVTPQTELPEPVDDVPVGHLTEPNPDRVALGLSVVFDVYPSLRDHLDDLEFGVYAGYKQNIGYSRLEPLCEPIEGTANLLLALPTVIGGAWQAAQSAADLVEARVEPGDWQPIPWTDDEVPIGHVVEQTDAFEWQAWNAFQQRFPGVTI